MKRIFIVIGLSSEAIYQVKCFRKEKDAEAYSNKLAKEMNFTKTDYYATTEG